MPAPLAKGCGSKSRSTPPSVHARAPHTHTQKPNLPFTTGIIIAASVIVAAGIAIYESPQVRQWVNESRRKIAIALHSLGDEIQPRRPSESSDDFEERKRLKREEIIRKNRNDLIKKAREEGIAVDLDELARIGQENVEMAERRQRPRTHASQKSFDDLVGSDGMLRKDTPTVQTATGTDASSSRLRHRGAAAGVAGFAAGSVAAAAVANPFSDDHVLFDHDQEEAPSPKPFVYTEPVSRESSATLEGDIVASPVTAPLIDLYPESVYLHPENPQTASIPHSEAGDAAAQSFYSFTSASSHPQELADDEADIVSTGTLTPRSDRSGIFGASVASVIGSQADDVAILSMQNDSDHDARSEIFSESGFTEAGFSEAGFSELGENGGILTPASWTDVGSDDESEWGGPAQGGQVSQVQPPQQH